MDYKYSLGNRDNQHSQGSSLISWELLLLSGLIHVRIINGCLTGADYLEITKNNVVPLMKMNINYPKNVVHDNCTTHKVKDVREFLK